MGSSASTPTGDLGSGLATGPRLLFGEPPFFRAVLRCDSWARGAFEPIAALGESERRVLMQGCAAVSAEGTVSRANTARAFRVQGATHHT